MLASPVNGFIIGFTPDSAVAGFFEIHLVRGS
jgi:biotin transporter BioY